VIRFFIVYVAIVVAIILTAKRALAHRSDISRKIRLRQYLATSFLIFMNFGGLRQASWTLGRLVEGDTITRLKHHFIALRELSSVLAAAIWALAVIGPSITALLVLGVARSSRKCRTILITYFPLLVIAEGVSSCINMRSSSGLHFVHGALIEYTTALSIWCLFAWPYVLVYRFYRGTSSDILFAVPRNERAEIDEN